MRDRIDLLKANIINSYKIETAYFSENWAGVGSTIFYTITMILFIKIVYANVKTFAGYVENEMFFLLFVSQLNVYLTWLWSYNNILYLIDSVRGGELDLILSKPVPTLFFITFNDINFIGLVKEGLPNLLFLGLVINWWDLHLTGYSVLVGLFIFICGQIAWHCFQFLSALPVFFVGHSSKIFQMAGELGDIENIPLEGFTGNLRTIFTTIIPALIVTQLSVSVALGKSAPLQMLALALGVAGAFLLLKQTGWIISLRSYSSASS